MVGLPAVARRQAGPGGPGGARRGRGAASGWRAPTGVAVDTYDERFTTVIAEQSLARRQGRASAQARARRIDAAAATVILQSWLDGPNAMTRLDHRATSSLGDRRRRRRRRRPRRRRRRADRRRAPRRRRAPLPPAPRRAIVAAGRARGRVARRVLILPSWSAGWFVLAAEPARRRGRRGRRSRSSRGGARKEAGDALDRPGRDRLVARVPALGDGVGRRRSRPARTRSDEIIGRPRRRSTRSSRGRRRGAAHDSRCCSRPGSRSTQIADRVGAAAGPRPRRVPRSSRRRAWCARSTSRPSSHVARGPHLARHLLRRRGPDRRRDPRSTIVGEFDEHADAVGLGNADRAGLTPYETVVERVADPGARRAAPTTSRTVVGGDRQPPAPGDAAADRRDALLREGRLPAGADQRRQADRLAVQHVPGQRACRPRRS